MVSCLSHLVAVVRVIVTSSCCGQGLVVNCHMVAGPGLVVVRGWWLLWSRVGGQLSSHQVAVVRGW